MQLCCLIHYPIKESLFLSPADRDLEFFYVINLKSTPPPLIKMGALSSLLAQDRILPSQHVLCWKEVDHGGQNSSRHFLQMYLHRRRKHLALTLVSALNPGWGMKDWMLMWPCPSLFSLLVLNNASLGVGLVLISWYKTHLGKFCLEPMKAN